MTSHQTSGEEKVTKMDHLEHVMEHQGVVIALGTIGAALVVVIVLIVCYKTGVLHINPDPDDHTRGIRACLRRRCGCAGPCCERMLCDTVSPSPSATNAAAAHAKFLEDRKKRAKMQTPKFVLKKPKV